MIAPLIFFTFLYCVGEYDALRINRKHWIPSSDKYYSWTFKLMFILAIQSNLMTFVGYSMLFAALFDLVLNWRRGIGLWHLGDNSKWDIFWKKHLTAYKIMRYSFTIIGLILITYDYINNF